jgi:predicted nucleic-acid-binding Zn-ribbon protein
MENICPKCQSAKIIPNVRIILDRNYNVVGDLSVEIYENPDALFFKGAHQGKLQARICGQCGYTELCLENPAQLFAAYQRNLNS